MYSKRKTVCSSLQQDQLVSRLSLLSPILFRRKEYFLRPLSRVSRISARRDAGSSRYGNTAQNKQIAIVSTKNKQACMIHSVVFERENFFVQGGPILNSNRKLDRVFSRFSQIITVSSQYVHDVGNGI